MLTDFEKLEILKEIELLIPTLKKNTAVNIHEYCKRLKKELSEKTIDYLIYTGLVKIMQEMGG